MDIDEPHEHLSIRASDGKDQTMAQVLDRDDPRRHRSARAKELASQLALRHVAAIALTWVDNAGITRVKAVPTRRLADAATWGVGMSPVFDVFTVDDSITTSTHIGGPVGDLRLSPDLDRLTVLAGQPGWAWAPVDRMTQEGEVYPACQRSFARRIVDDAARRGLDVRMAFEVEWFVGRDTEDGGVVPACNGPAYGMTRLIELSDYVHDLLDALAAENVPVEQFHPEYARGQLELSVGATDPVAAADRLVLVRQTIRAVSQTHGWKASFAPVVEAAGVGNGPHLHLSAWADGANLMAGGSGPYGLSARGESLVAELLNRLPALCAIGAPSPASYLRLVPQRWAGPYQCWGRENREAGIRLVTGTTGSEHTAANIEVKCVDGSANPYLAVGTVLAVALAGIDRGRSLPPEMRVDPATLPPGEQPPRLPQSVPEAMARLEADDVLVAALGEPLLQAFLAVHRAEVEMFSDATPDEIAAATRWAY
jgi:glutamine synthetase